MLYPTSNHGPQLAQYAEVLGLNEIDCFQDLIKEINRANVYKVQAVS